MARPQQPYRAALVGVSMLERVAPAHEDVQQEAYIDLDDVWQRTVSGEDEARLMGSLLSVEMDEREVERPRMK